MVRCFEDPDVQHVMGEVDPARDREIINIELGLADLASVEKRLDKTARAAKSGDPQAKLELRLLEPLQRELAAGRPARVIRPTEEEAAAYRSFNLLTAKPVLYAANVPEDEISSGNRFVDALRAALERDQETAEVVTFSAKVEAELAELAPEDRSEFLESLGPHRVRDWTAWPTRPTTCSGSRATSPPARRRSAPGPIHRGDKAPAAAGVIHSDFEKGFIRAETVAYERLRAGGRLEAGAGAGAGPGRGQGVRGAGRRRDAVPVQQLTRSGRHYAPLPPPRFRYLPRSHISSPASTPGPGQPSRPVAAGARPKEGVMTRQYEVVYIFDSALEEAAINERLARFNALIQKAGIEPPQVNHWGKRTLAYPVKKHETGYYVVAKFDAEATALPEFERAIKLDEGVLRFLVVVSEGAQPVPVTAGKSDEEDDE